MTVAAQRRSFGSMAEPSSRGEVVIVGGGVAALETLMALRDLAPDAVSVTLVAAEPDFVYRPMSVAEPFGLGEARRYPLRRVVDDFGAALVQAGVAAVDAPARRIVLRSGDTIGYDTLVLAPGARMLPAFDDVAHVRRRRAAPRPCARCSTSSSRAALGGSRSSRRPLRVGRCRCTSSRC